MISPNGNMFSSLLSLPQLRDQCLKGARNSMRARDGGWLQRNTLGYPQVSYAPLTVRIKSVQTQSMASTEWGWAHNSTPEHETTGSS